MMKDTNKEIKQSSLIHQKIRKASFVPLESQDTEKFKYNLRFNLNRYFNKKLIALKRGCNRILQKPRLWFQQVDFVAVRKDISVWLFEATIEGVIINFSVWALLDWKFNFITVMAWGFAVKQILSIYWRLRKDGSDTTIFKKN